MLNHSVKRGLIIEDWCHGQSENEKHKNLVLIKHAEIEYIGQAWHISVQIYKNSRLNSGAVSPNLHGT